jgi:hypothetical protein
VSERGGDGMLRRLRSWLTARRFARAFASYDRAIEAARRAHRPVRDLIARKRQALHQALGARS